MTENDPIHKFKEWFHEAIKSEIDVPDAVALATTSTDFRPSVRMVLLKDVDESGFVFYTNLGSRKASEIKLNPFAALCFHWKSLKKQVRVEGKLTPVSNEEADKYFATRARISQIGAWASIQSTPMEDRFSLEKRVLKYTAKFNFGSVPRPPFWSGYRLNPDSIEFWVEKEFRMHDRFKFSRADSQSEWKETRLYP